MIAVVIASVVAILAALVLLHRYVWRRLVRDTTVRGSTARRVGTIVFVAWPLLLVVAFAAARGGAPFWLEKVLAWPGFMWFALFIYLLLWSLAGELVRPLLLRWLTARDAAAAGVRAAPAPGDARQPHAAPARDPETVPAGDPELVTGVPDARSVAVAEPGMPDKTGPQASVDAADMSRRLFVSRVVAGAVAVATAGTVGSGMYSVLRGPRVKGVTVPLAKLPRSAHGFRIALVADMHLGPVLGRGFAQRVVDTVNATQPDLIAVVGDMVDGEVDELAPIAAPVAGLRSRHGTYFVTGNHEYFSGAEQWVEHVQELGMRVLANARTELPGFDLAGVNDVTGERYGGGPDFARALGDRDRSRTAVLLAHQPVVIDESVRYGVDLQLSGHTHGGQLWPGRYLVALANPTVHGLERYGDTQLYVTRGAGAFGPPVRVATPSDITVVTLAAKQA